MVTLIDDCEGDIYEKFAAPHSAHVHLLGRAEHDRVLRDGAKLWAAMASRRRRSRGGKSPFPPRAASPPAPRRPA